MTDKKTKRPVRYCRICGIGLLTNAEYVIGVHVGCVSDANQRPKPIPGPNYGTEPRQSDS